MNHRLLIQASRLFLYLIVVAMMVLQHLIQDGFTNWDLAKSFYTLACIGLLMHLIPLVSLDKYYSYKKFVALTFAVDVVLISFLLGASELNQSLFLFMYLVVIILSGLIFEYRGALLVAVLSSIGFTMASWFDPEIKAMSFLFMLMLNNIAFYAVAAISGYLSSQLNLFAQKLESQNLSMRVIQELNQLIIETIPSGLMTVTVDGTILQSNPGAQIVFLDDSIEGRNLKTFFPNENLNFSNLSQAQKMELKYSKNGDDRLLSLSLLPQFSENLVDKTFLVIIEDLTQVRKLEFAMRQSEKMAAVGQLAAGIAHEIRNPLAGISGSVELLSQTFSDEDDKKLGKIILKEINRLNNLITEFLEFSKPEKPPVDSVDLNSLLKEVLQGAKANVNASIKVEEMLSDQAVILGHRDKLKQAFLNIVINSFQAMDKQSSPVLKVSTIAKDDMVLVRIEDNGCGMKAETRKRMFEPFLTTKPKGTGLGLAITHKILEAHLVQIDVQSEEGKGTIFTLAFPRKTFESQVFN